MKNYLLAIFLLLPTLVFSSGGVANITALRGNADITDGNNLKKAKLKDDLYKIDTLITHKKTKAQLIFEDKTIVTVGKNSHFAVEDYLSDGDDQEASFKLFNGAVRVITGKIGKISPQKFKIKTKTATIGIRGTNFIVIASPKRGDLIVCTLGEITIKGKSKKVFTVGKGYMARVSPNGIVQAIEAYSADDLDIVLNNAFEYKSTINLSFNELILFFDNLFSGNTQDDENLASTTDEESDVDEEEEDSPLIALDDEFSEIPLEETVVIESDTSSDVLAVDDSVDDEVNTVGETETAVDIIDDVVEAVPVYILGNANKVNILNESNFINYNQPLSLLIGSYESIGIFTSDSQFKDSRTGMDLMLNTEPISYVSAYNFKSSFVQTSYTDEATSEIYNMQSEGYINTIPDIDENDEITWGIWSIPISVEDTQGTSNEEWTGYFIAGNLTSTTVIDEYIQGNKIATYTGSLIGTAYEFDNAANMITTDFSGSVISNVDFGASQLDTTLSYSVNGDSYQIIMNDTISGNQFGGTYGYGAFYGEEGKTIGGQFSLDDTTKSRHMIGAYEAKTDLIH